jgi:hypothetical protein
MLVKAGSTNRKGSRHDGFGSMLLTEEIYLKNKMYKYFYKCDNLIVC